MCEHRYLDDPNGLKCTRKDAHDPLARGGHTYVSGVGADLAGGEGPEDQ